MSSSSKSEDVFRNSDFKKTPTLSPLTCRRGPFATGRRLPTRPASHFALGKSTIASSISELLPPNLAARGRGRATWHVPRAAGGPWASAEGRHHRGPYLLVRCHLRAALSFQMPFALPFCVAPSPLAFHNTSAHFLGASRRVWHSHLLRQSLTT